MVVVACSKVDVALVRVVGAAVAVLFVGRCGGAGARSPQDGTIGSSSI